MYIHVHNRCAFPIQWTTSWLTAVSAKSEGRLLRQHRFFLTSRLKLLNAVADMSVWLTLWNIHSKLVCDSLWMLFVSLLYTRPGVLPLFLLSPLITFFICIDSSKSPAVPYNAFTSSSLALTIFLYILEIVTCIAKLPGYYFLYFFLLPSVVVVVTSNFSL